MRVALVHDWLTGLRGGERVLLHLVEMYPEAHLYTLIHVPGAVSPAIDRMEIRASALSRLPGVARHYRLLLPLFPWAIRRFRLDDYDLVISTSHAVAKGVATGAGTPHISYCFTPMRYVWDQADLYLGRGLFRAASHPLAWYLRRFDKRTNTPEAVTRFVAISHTVADRIARHYGRQADVVFPPVDTERIRPDGKAPDDYYLMVGGFVPYKCERLAIDAFRLLEQRGQRRKLVIAGDGPSRAALLREAPAFVELPGRVSDLELAGLYARCRALIHPQEEDFGIAALEAQAAGRPVIAFGRGGARDTVVPLASDSEIREPQAHAERQPPTGLWFGQQTDAALAAAVATFEKREAAFRPAEIRAWAERFGADRFRDEWRAQVDRVLREQA